MCCHVEKYLTAFIGIYFLYILRLGYSSAIQYNVAQLLNWHAAMAVSFLTLCHVYNGMYVWPGIVNCSFIAYYDRTAFHVYVNITQIMQIIHTPEIFFLSSITHLRAIGRRSTFDTWYVCAVLKLVWIESWIMHIQFWYVDHFNIWIWFGQSRGNLDKLNSWIEKWGKWHEAAIAQI